MASSMKTFSSSSSSSASSSSAKHTKTMSLEDFVDHILPAGVRRAANRSSTSISSSTNKKSSGSGSSSTKTTASSSTTSTLPPPPPPPTLHRHKEKATLLRPFQHKKPAPQKVLAPVTNGFCRVSKERLNKIKPVKVTETFKYFGGKERGQSGGVSRSLRRTQGRPTVLFAAALGAGEQRVAFRREDLKAGNDDWEWENLRLGPLADDEDLF